MSESTSRNSRSFLKTLFAGEIAEGAIFPFPEVSAEERETVSTFLESLRQFAQAKIDPARIEREHKIGDDVVAGIAELGVLGASIPEDFGGYGFSASAYCRMMQEIAVIDASLAILVGGHQSIGCKGLMMFGTDEQKKKWLPQLASGQMIAAFALTEPEAGSDAKATQVSAVRDGDHYVVNGTKIYCTNGTHAQVIVFTARTGGAPGDTDHINAFLVEKGTPGLVYGKLEDKLGLRGSDTRELVFQDCRIPVANRLGDEGKGFHQFMKTLEGGRISIGAMALGLAQGALDCALPYARARKQFGQRLIDLQPIAHRLSDMAVEIQAARNLVYEAAWRKDHGLPFARHASMGKLYASEVGMRCAHHAVQILGGTGYTREAPAERILRDVKLTEIGEGTSEIQRLVISRFLDRDGAEPGT
jgi:butyryl-CoA dehydrogenase